MKDRTRLRILNHHYNELFHGDSIILYDYFGSELCKNFYLKLWKHIRKTMTTDNIEDSGLYHAYIWTELINEWSDMKANRDR